MFLCSFLLHTSKQSGVSAAASHLPCLKDLSSFSVVVLVLLAVSDEGVLP